MAKSIVDNKITYKSLIESVAILLYNKLNTDSNEVQNGVNFISDVFTFKNNFTPKSKNNEPTGMKLNFNQNVNESYTSPSKDEIVEDIETFMTSINIPIDDTVPTEDGFISFLFALNYFLEKAVIKKISSADDNTYHLHYVAPSSSSYIKIPGVYDELNTITTNKISNIYNNLQKNSLLSDRARTPNVSSGVFSSCSSSSSSSSSCSSSSCSSSSSSSSCSSSSCSSSSSLFIVYFNIA